MTYSLAGRCLETNRIGYAVATSSVAVGARVGGIAQGCVVFSQARTDPRLHAVGLARWQKSQDAEEVLEAMKAEATALHWRQLGVLTMTGPGLHFTGSSCLANCGGLTGSDCLAIGNFLGSADVLPQMIQGFKDCTGNLEERLIAGMCAGEAAGSEREPLQSAAIVVMGELDLKDTDLRIDCSRQPLRDLDELYRDWSPKAAAYRQRALDPDNAPSSSIVEGNVPQ